MFSAFHLPHQRNTGVLLLFLLFTISVTLPGCAGEGVSAEEDYRRASKEFEQGKLLASATRLKSALKKNPLLWDARNLLGQIYVIGGDYLSAEKELARFHAHAPDEPSHLPPLMRSLNQLGRYQEALDLGKGLEPRADVMLEMASALAGLGQSLQAAATLEQVLELQPGMPAAHKSLALMARQRGDDETADMQLAMAMASDPQDIEAWLMKGQFAFMEDELDETVQALEHALTLQKYHPSILANQANILLAFTWLKNAQPEKAEPYVNALEKTSKTSAIFKFLKANLLYHQDDLDGAVTLLREVLANAPTHAKSLSLAGVIEAKKGNLNQARNFLERALASRGNLTGVRRTLGVIYLKLNMSDEAVKLLVTLVRELPGNADAWALLGDAYLQNGEPAKATEALSRAVALGLDDPASRTKLALGFVGSGDTDSAIKELRKAADNDESFEKAEYLLALAYLEKGDLQAATESVGRLLAAQEDNAQYHNLRGAILQRGGDKAGARAAYLRALELQPDYTPAAINLVGMELQAGEREQAQERLENILIKHPYHAGAMFLKATILMEQGMPEEAVELLETSRAKNWDDVASRKLLLRTYQTEETAEAGLAIADEILTLQKGDTDALMGSVRPLIYLGRLEEAYDNAAQLLARLPESAQAHYLAALVLVRQGETARAGELLKRAVELNSDFTQAKFLLAEMGTSSLSGGESSTDDVVLKVRNLIQKRKMGMAIRTALEHAQKNPKDIQAQTLLSAAYRSNGQIDMARQVLQEQLGEGQAAIPVLLSLADLEIAVGEIEQARSWYNKVLVQKPLQEDALLGLASLAAGGESRQLIAKSYQAHPKSVRSMISMAKSYLQSREEVGKAVPVVDSLLQQLPADPGVLQLACQVYLGAGELAKASTTAAQFRERFPKNSDAYLQLALVKLASDDPGEGRRLLEQALQLNRENYRALMALAELDYVLNDLRSALQATDRVLAKAPEFVDALNLKAKIKWQAGKLGEAVSLYRKVWTVKPSTLHAVKLGQALWSSGQRNAAYEFLREYLADAPEDVPIRTLLGDMLYTEDRVEQAVEEYTRVLKKEPENVTLLNRLAQTYAKVNDRRAIDIASKAYRIDPEYPELLDTYGWLLLMDGDVEQALNLFRKAIQMEKNILNPVDRATLRYHLAVAYRKSGDNASSRRELVQLLEQFDEFPEREKAEQELNRLR